MKQLSRMLLLLISFSAGAQQADMNRGTQILENIRTSSDRVIQAGLPARLPVESGAIAVFFAKQPELGHPSSTLHLKYRIESGIGSHLFFEQHYHGIPVYGGYLKVNIAKDGSVLSVFDHLFDSRAWTGEAFQVNVPMAKPYWIPENGLAVPAYQTFSGHTERVSLENGITLFEQSTRLGFSRDDTTVSGKVFYPDPITPLSKVYGGNYKHFDGLEYALLNDQRVSRLFPATFTDSFRLANQYSIIISLDSPWGVPVASAFPVFDYTRSQLGFKQVMCTYHIYNTQLFIQSIGFNNVARYQLHVDADGTTDDNSFFQYSPDTSLRFGVGGVPDTEDADVIVHEYTHAISHSINPTGIGSQERRAVEEGLCDAMAAAYSKRLYTFNWKWFGNWDGHNEFWNGRNTASLKTYDDLVSLSDFYSNSEIWSSALSDVTEDLGPDVAMRLLLTSIYSYTPSTTIPQAAQLFMQADSLLYQKSNSWKIGGYFANRKLLQYQTGILETDAARQMSIYNSAGFASGEGDVTLVFEGASGGGTLTITDLTGRQVGQWKVTADRISLSPANFEAGMYIANFRCGTHSTAFRLLRQ